MLPMHLRWLWEELIDSEIKLSEILLKCKVFGNLNCKHDVCFWKAPFIARAACGQLLFGLEFIRMSRKIPWYGGHDGDFTPFELS